jgi:uncharacterized protein (DUF305 family)
MKITRITTVSAAAVLGIAALAGCTTVNVSAPAEAPASAAAEAGHNMDGHSMDGHEGHDMDGHSMDGHNMDGVDADIHFLQMMIPHHEQALTMAQLAVTNGASTQVQALAKQIADAQGPEIAQMKAWLTEAGEPLDGGDHGDMGAHHDMAMDGMLTDEELSALEQAKGPEFDRLFLTGMITHHEGAIIMAEHVKQAGDDPKVAELADVIITAQKAEIAEMKQMLGEG